MRRDKAYYRISIDYNYSARNEGRHLSLHSIDNVNEQNILGEVKGVILNDLPKEFFKAYGIRVKTEVERISEGSIELVVSAMFGFSLGLYYFIANYKNFKEGLLPLREDMERLLRNLLRKTAPELEASVSLTFPAIREYDDHPFRIIGHRDYGGSSYFWPFLISMLVNVALLSFVGLLVWKAVKQVYFP